MSQFINFNTIIGNGKSYKVPIYQRDYSWDKDDWEDLWNDILEIPNDKTHYLGYIVLQPVQEGEEAYWVIDGQQRLTTLSIFVLAVTALLKKWADTGIESENNKIRFEKITERYLGNFSTSKLTISPKIVLNRNNDDYYKSWLLKLRTPAVISKLKPSQRLMQKAFNYFFEQLSQHFNSNPSGSDLAEFLEKIVGNGIIFTQIVVQNDLDAFKVFETLNARGVKLSTADLLKNYLFRLTHQLGDLDLEEAERRWQNIVDSLRANDLTTYIRHFWNSRNRLERQPTLFKSIKRSIDSGSKAFDLLNDLERNIQYYTAFNDPHDEIWEKEERNHLKTIALLNVSTCYSLMLAALDFLPRNEFKILLREVAIITFRYNLSDLNPNEAERVFGAVALQIAKKEITHVKDAVLALKNIYVPDANFVQAFSTIQINSKRKKDLVKYILVKLENQLSGADNQPEDAISTIEHILPENPGSHWETAFAPDTQDDYKYRLGNYTLLEATINHKLDNNTPFIDKLAKYKTSKYKLSSEYCTYDDFNPKVIALRQEQMARLAKGIWRSGYIQPLQ